MWEEFDDETAVTDSGVCDQCQDPLCPGCGPTVSGQLLKWVAAAVTILVAVVLVFGGIRNSTNSESGSAAPQEDPSNPPPTTVQVGPSSTSTSTTTSIPQAPVIGPTGNPTQDVIKSVVQVAVFANGKMCGWGSGTVLDDPLTVITNEHVIASNNSCQVDSIEVWTVDSLDERPRPTYRAVIKSKNVNADLAMLTLSPMAADSPPLVPVPRSGNAEVGEDIFVIGFPSIGGSTITVSKGVVSGFTTDVGVTWVKTDASISGGNSGGAAVNVKGLMIGVPTMASASEDGEVVDCRPVIDSNRDGAIDDYDECKPIGGFLNLLSPIEEVEKLLASTTSIQTPTDTTVEPPSDQARRMLGSVNQERISRGLVSLTWCTNLTTAAHAHAADMATRSYFDHDSPEGDTASDRAAAAGYGDAGENIAVGYPSVARVMNGWMTSPRHKANILGASYQHFGYGVARGRFEGRSVLYWVQNFGVDGTC